MEIARTYKLKGKAGLNMFLSTNEKWNDRNGGCHLQMVGVCLENVVGSGQGPKLRYIDGQGLKGVKIPHAEVETALQCIRNLSGVRGTFIWNTCNRFEVYFFHDGDSNDLVTQVRSLLFESLEGQSDVVNRLSDSDAIHHLVRTAVGFNSGLPGERDVAMQLHSAIRHSEVVGCLGPLARNLAEWVFKAAEEVREETVWRNYSPSYCDAALEVAMRDTCLGRILSGKVTIIGSSNTSRSCIEILRNRFGISEENVTVYHRCHHKDGQMKAMKRAARGSFRVRVHDYDDEVIHNAIAESHLVIIGIDRSHPVVTGEKLSRYFSGQKDVIVIDFNTFGSSEGLEGLEGVQVIESSGIEQNVREYAERLARNVEFQSALRSVETLVRDRVRSFNPGLEEENLIGVGRETFAMGAV